jgi:hypothetical protein
LAQAPLRGLDELIDVRGCYVITVLQQLHQLLFGGGILGSNYLIECSRWNQSSGLLFTSLSTDVQAVPIIPAEMQLDRLLKLILFRGQTYQPRTQEKIKGTTIVASDSMMNFGVSSESLPQVIFSFGTAPE